MKKNVIIIIAIISALVIGSVGLILFNNNVKDFVFNNDSGDIEEVNTENIDTEDIDTKDIPSGQPYLQMKVLDYPTSVNDMCQKVVFTFEAKNIGDTTLKYGDLASDYYIGIGSEDALGYPDNPIRIETIDMSKDYADDAGLIPYTKVVSNFGEIKPGQKKEITFKSLTYTIYSANEYFWMNGFDNVVNGNFTYYMEFGKLSDKGVFYSSNISKSNAVSISTDLYDSDGISKYCDYELITDPNINFYE